MESDRWHEGTSGSTYTVKATPYSHRTQLQAQTQTSKRTGSENSRSRRQRLLSSPLLLEKILARPDGEEAIDVYQALDMGVPGILAYRSIVNGNVPIPVPDFRKKEDREEYRHDRWCTNPEKSGGDLAPYCSFGTPDISHSVYEEVRRRWQEMIK